MRTHGKIKFLVHLDMRYSAAREMTGGILRFASLHQPLEVQFASDTPSNESFDFYREWHPDAIITDDTYHALGDKRFSAICGRAAVFVNTTPPKQFRWPKALLTTDEEALARGAADLFLRKGLANFAFVETPCPRSWSSNRREHFHKFLAAKGKELYVFPPTGSIPWREQRTALSTWLKALPKPCGVWVAYDQRAKHVLDACIHARIPVPEQIQLLGTDNESYICEQLTPSLSSLAPDFDSGGFRSAEFLYALLQGNLKVPSETVHLKFGLSSILERLSTEDINGTARRVTAAQSLIRRFATKGFGVMDIASSLGVSQRLLQKNYRMVTGRTVCSDIILERLMHPKRLLRKTTIPIGSIGSQCGFANDGNLKVMFKRTFGCTMSAYRRGTTEPES